MLKDNPIYLITGIMAAGKSTIAQLLAERFAKSVHLRGDIFRKMIVSGREDMAANPTDEALRQLYLRYDIAAKAASIYYRAGFTVIWQDVMVGKVLSEVIARIRPYPVYVIVLCPAPEIVAEREIMRYKSGYGKGFTPENFHQLMSDETPRIGLWLDSSQQTPEETVNEIITRTQSGEGRVIY